MPVRKGRGLKVSPRGPRVGEREGTEEKAATPPGAEAGASGGPSTKASKAMLAVNGRVGRRVACVLDDEGIEIEMLDMEGEEEEEA